ncbi:type III secretion system outer membrane ring subunit SctC [Pseudomonas sp. SDO5271_S396]
MYADFPATILRARLCGWLLCAALLLSGASARGETYLAHEQNLHTFFTALSAPLGLPVVVSREVARRHLSGTFDFDAAQQTLQTVAQQHDLIWYGDGQVLHLYHANEAKSSAVALRHISVDRLRDHMRRSGLDESRYPLRKSGERTFYVSGPPNYVDQVLRLAQLMDRPKADLRVGAQAFRVVQVLNTHVADRQYSLGDSTVNVPGLAATLETLLSAEQKGALADRQLAVFAYPDTNSLLIKGKPAQLRFIERLIAELDVPKQAIEVALWRVDIERDELQKINLEWASQRAAPFWTTRVLEPQEDNRLMAQLSALERRRRANLVALPAILAQENVPAVFQEHHRFYLPASRNESTDSTPVRYSTQVSVLPRIAETNEIEMLLSVEDGRRIDTSPRGKGGAVGHMSIGSVVRVSQGRRLWVGAFERSAESGKDRVRLFVIQARAVGGDSKGLVDAFGPPPLTAAQYERVKRAFVRPGRDLSQ